LKCDTLNLTVTESGADSATSSGVVSVDAGYTFWSASAYAETRAQVAESSAEAWDAVNKYVGTYSAPTGEMASQGVVSTNGGTTYWESANWQQSIATLSTFDFGLAQISWMSHNVDHGWTSSAASGGDNVTDQTTSQSGATTTMGAGITTTTAASSSSVFTGTDGQLSTRVGLAGGNNMDSVSSLSGVSSATAKVSVSHLYSCFGSTVQSMLGGDSRCLAASATDCRTPMSRSRHRTVHYTSLQERSREDDVVMMDVMSQVTLTKSKMKTSGS
jgi:hypothetical protein